MQPAANENKTAVPELRVFRPESPSAALGLAVSHLMTKPAFANLKFGEWSRILVGQINRKHYCFVVDSKNQIQGFPGLGDHHERARGGVGRGPRRLVLRE